MSSLKTIRPLLQADVAYMLRRELGPARGWEDLLSDMRQGKTTYHGLILLPIGRTHRGRTGQPLYFIGDLRQFIRDAKAISPPAPNAATALTPLFLAEVDPTWERRAWRNRVLEPITSGAPPAL